MRAPTSGKVGATTAWDGYLTVEQSTDPRNSPCPWACVSAGRFVELRTLDGYPAGAWCGTCDQAITRTEWLSLLEEPEQ